MRRLFLVGFALLWLLALNIFAGEIREFDLRTIERLGNELTRVTQTRDKGATTPVRTHARDTAMAALKGKLFDARYQYIVLNDPDGSGFLVYALASGNKTSIGGHFRVTVSSNGSEVERIDKLLRGILRQRAMPAGATPVVSSLFDPDNKMPDETYIYTNRLSGVPIYVGFKDKSIWEIANGRITRLKEKLD